MACGRCVVVLCWYIILVCCQGVLSVEWYDRCYMDALYAVFCGGVICVLVCCQGVLSVECHNRCYMDALCFAFCGCVVRLYCDVGGMMMI